MRTQAGDDCAGTRGAPIQVVAFGPRALLVRVVEDANEESFHRVQSIATHLRREPPPGLVEFVPGFNTLLLEFDPAVVPQPSTLAPGLVARFRAEPASSAPESRLVEIPVIYDGPDLARVAEWNRLAVVEVARLHAAVTYRVHLLGFAPGFPYLGGLDGRLHTPRLASPRLTVPAGSVAIGGVHTGIYPIASPGGWNIIGHTTLRIFDPERGASAGSDEAMFLLRPGDRVRFVAPA